MLELALVLGIKGSSGRVPQLDPTTTGLDSEEVRTLSASSPDFGGGHRQVRSLLAQLLPQEFSLARHQLPVADVVEVGAQVFLLFSSEWFRKGLKQDSQPLLLML